VISLTYEYGSSSLASSGLDNPTDGVWETFMAEPVHNYICDGFHLGFICDAADVVD